MNSENTYKYPLKIICDTNILYYLYGQTLKAGRINYKNLSRHKKLFFLAKKGFIKIYVTPQIYKEFLTARGKSPEKIKKFNDFTKNFLTVINFSQRQDNIVARLTHDFGRKYTTKKNSHGEAVTTNLFKHAHNPNEKNYADAVILAQAAVVNLPIITNNVKDFAGYKEIGNILNKHSVRANVQVFSENEFLDEFFTYQDVKNLKRENRNTYNNSETISFS